MGICRPVKNKCIYNLFNINLLDFPLYILVGINRINIIFLTIFNKTINEVFIFGEIIISSDFINIFPYLFNG